MTCSLSWRLHQSQETHLQYILDKFNRKCESLLRPHRSFNNGVNVIIWYEGSTRFLKLVHLGLVGLRWFDSCGAGLTPINERPAPSLCCWVTTSRGPIEWGSTITSGVLSWKLNLSTRTSVCQFVALRNASNLPCLLGGEVETNGHFCGQKLGSMGKSDHFARPMDDRMNWRWRMRYKWRKCRYQVARDLSFFARAVSFVKWKIQIPKVRKSNSIIAFSKFYFLWAVYAYQKRSGLG